MLSFRLDVYLHTSSEGEVLKELAFIRSTLNTLATQGAIMAGELARLQTEVTEMAGVVDSAIVLINGLAQQIRDLAGQPAELAKLADDLDAKAGALAAAVAANTPTP
jgi:TolA-binding protein